MSGTEQQGAAGTGVPLGWPHPQLCPGGFACANVPGKPISCFSFTPCSQLSSALWLTGGWEPGCREGGAGQAAPPQCLPSPQGPHSCHLGMRGKGHTPPAIPLHRFGYTILFSGQSLAVMPSQCYKSCFGNALFSEMVICQQPLSPTLRLSLEAAGCQRSPWGAGRQAVPAQLGWRTGRLPVAACSHSRGRTDTEKAAQAPGTPTHPL